MVHEDNAVGCVGGIVFEVVPEEVEQRVPLVRHLGRVHTYRTVQRHEVTALRVERVVLIPELLPIYPQRLLSRRIPNVAVARGEIDRDVFSELARDPHQFRVLFGVVGMLDKITRYHDERGLEPVCSRDGLLIQGSLRECPVARRETVGLEQPELGIAQMNEEERHSR